MRKNKFLKYGIPRYCCFAGGGAAQTADPAPTDPAPIDPAPKAADPAPKAADPAPKEPGKAEPAKGAENTYTTEQLETEKQKAAAAAVEAYKKHLDEAKDFEKMTDAEKVVYLQKQMADEKLTGYTSQKLTDAGLPVDLAAFVKGSDEKDTDERIKTLKAAYDKGVQAGVEQRFKANGYVPKGTAAGKTDEETKKRPRGVSVK